MAEMEMNVTNGGFGDPHDALDRPLGHFDPETDLFDVGALSEEAEADVEGLRTHREAGDWEALYRTGSEMKARAESRLHALLRAREKLNHDAAAVRALADRSGSSPEDPPEFDESLRADLAERLRDRLDGPLGTLLEDPEQVADDLEAGRIEVSESSTDFAEDARLTAFPRMLRGQRDLLTWQVGVGYAELLAARLYGSIEAADPARHDDDVVDALDGRVTEIREEVLSLLRAYYADLVSGDFEGLAATARRGTSYPDELVEEVADLGRRLREARRFYRRSDERGSETDAARVAGVEMRLGRTTRLLAFLVAASWRGLFLARQGDVGAEAREAVETARETRFESLVRDGVNADVGDLLDDPAEYDGRLVEVEGFAEGVRLVTDDGYGTKFALVDAGEENRIEVFYPYRDLTEWFLYDGSYLRLHGEFVASCEHAGGAPDVHLDAVNVGEHGERSWFDYLVNELASADVYELYPSHANVAWSIEAPPADGGGD